ncbi:MAG: ROK family protein [Tepidisphaeraceae bacterium]|jgi:glucokinase
MQLGIDIGGTSVKAAGVENGRCLWTGQSGFYAKPTTDELRAAIRTAAGGRAAGVQAIGLCVPGLLDANERKITEAFNVAGLVGIPLDRLVPESLNLPTGKAARICNDAQAAAFDVFQSRRIRGRLLVLTLGTGIGIAVLDDGRPLCVEGESPGHIGQIDVSIAGHDAVGPDGGAGGLEGYLGVAALRANYGPDVSPAVAKFTGDEPPMLALVRTIRIAHAIYRPDHVCLCGGIGIRLKHLIPTLRDKIQTRLTSLARSGWTLTTGDDDFHAARGAARMVTSTLSVEC